MASRKRALPTGLLDVSRGRRPAACPITVVVQTSAIASHTTVARSTGATKSGSMESSRRSTSSAGRTATTLNPRTPAPRRRGLADTTNPASQKRSQARPIAAATTIGKAAGWKPTDTAASTENRIATPARMSTSRCRIVDENVVPPSEAEFRLLRARERVSQPHRWTV